MSLTLKQSYSIYAALLLFCIYLLIKFIQHIHWGSAGLTPCPGPWIIEICCINSSWLYFIFKTLLWLCKITCRQKTRFYKKPECNEWKIHLKNVSENLKLKSLSSILWFLQFGTNFLIKCDVWPFQLASSFLWPENTATPAAGANKLNKRVKGQTTQSRKSSALQIPIVN